MKKRILVNLIACIMFSLILFSGCSGKEPVYESNGFIRSFGSVNPNGNDKKALKDYRDSGINTIALYINNDEYYYSIGGKSMADHRVYPDTKEWDIEIQNCIDANLDVFIRGLNEHYFDNFDYDYNKFAGVKGLYLWDEPGYSDFQSKLADILVPWVNENYPNMIWYVNLFPSYAYTGKTLGTEADDSYPGYSTYEKYIYAYADIVLNKVKGEKVLSIDHYPLRIDEARRRAFISDSWLFDLMIGKMGAIRANCPFATCIQCYDNASPIRNIKSKADISLQVYTSFAFGSTGLEYYQYGEYNNWPGMVDKDWNIRQPYYFVQEVNKEIEVLDDYLLNFDWQGVYCSNGYNGEAYNDAFDNLDKIKDNKKLTKLKNIKSVSSSYDAIIGQFADKNGKNGYMVVNFTEPTEKKVNNVELNIKNTLKL